MFGSPHIDDVLPAMSIGLVQEEHLDPRIHPDCFDSDVPTPGLTVKRHHGMVVTDRIRWLLRTVGICFLFITGYCANKVGVLLRAHPPAKTSGYNFGLMKKIPRSP